jgi:hypothetical protein
MNWSFLGAIELPQINKKIWAYFAMLMIVSTIYVTHFYTKTVWIEEVPITNKWGEVKMKSTWNGDGIGAYTDKVEKRKDNYEIYLTTLLIAAFAFTYMSKMPRFAVLSLLYVVVGLLSYQVHRVFRAYPYTDVSMIDRIGELSKFKIMYITELVSMIVVVATAIYIFKQSRKIENTTTEDEIFVSI